MERFTEEDMVHLVAYQNLYGVITPNRLDLVIARLGMDVAAPHMKKGKRPRLRDHLFVWSRASRPRRTGRDLLEAVRGIQAVYDRQAADQQADRRRRRRRAVPSEPPHSG
ncbi:hypothetical protein SSP24_06050 [Streptomyces spinoverrucosus]|uniref:Uncharacterized protein n=1 Tax=Streptomyces spinoverrucosus TaxID=284043 RepID=A0A4Y3VAV6_9ACTN|nr:hypothetical protein [Streptomyces spinoverrucosus]GEC02950.1 hypothetical protein SSP24_06050 [Streptomyces spinoverrucosus]GHB39351.1 hypothetical protein GCM10010397_06540 [Streptomyces spinoverrucosus]